MLQIITYIIVYIQFGFHSCTERIHWTSEMTKLLIKHYKDMELQFKNKRIPINVSWDDVASLMRVCGYPYLDGSQCRSRYDYLLKIFKNIEDHNSKSGFNRESWEYHSIFEELHGKKPEFAPVALASNLSGFKRIHHSDQQTDSSDEDFFGKDYVATKPPNAKGNIHLYVTFIYNMHKIIKKYVMFYTVHSCIKF